MKRIITFLFLFVSCATTNHPVPNPVPPIPVPIPTPEVIAWDTIHRVKIIQDSNKLLSITDFGAVGDGIHDDADAVQLAVEYVIIHPQILFVPLGQYLLSHSIIMKNPVDGRFFTIHIAGIFSNKSSSNEYLSKFIYTGRSSFAFGIQLGRSVEIENISVIGQYSFPNRVTNANIGTIKFADWNDGSVSDSRYSPYAGISIDPYTTGAPGGSSDVTIRNCAVKQFMVDVAMSANGSTLNCEMINILDCDLEAARDLIAIGQDQSKTINIMGLKAWASFHTAIDGVNYGRGTGGGSVFCYNWNMAGNGNQLFNIVTDRFPLSVVNLYFESLFRIGNVGNGAGANFVNCSFDFLTGPGMPAADYLLLGQANFSGGCLRYYDGNSTKRMNFSNGNIMFRDMTLSSPPIIIGLYGMGSYPTPHFDNVHNYNSGGLISGNYDTLIKLNNLTSGSIDTLKWTATYSGPGLGTAVKIGDYILGSPNSSNRKYYDNPGLCNTIQIGRVISISGDTVSLDDIGLNAPYITGYDAIYVDRIK